MVGCCSQFRRVDKWAGSARAEKAVTEGSAPGVEGLFATGWSEAKEKQEEATGTQDTSC